MRFATRGRRLLNVCYRAIVPAGQLWRRALPSEAAYWAEYIRTGGGPWPEEYLFRLDPEASLDDEPLITDRLDLVPGERVAILDVGAGPLTRLGKHHPGREILITATDPLAKTYARLLRDAGVTPPVATLECRGEALSKFFGETRFDVVYARNSLDHCEDPIAVIENMVEIVEPHGFIAMSHYRNEGRNTSYSGLHQWNIDVRDRELVFWGPRGEHNVTALLADRATVECWQFAERWILAVITRNV